MMYSKTRRTVLSMTGLLYVVVGLYGKPFTQSLPNQVLKCFRLLPTSCVYQSMKTPLKDLAILAILICRTGMYLNPQASIATDLAANHMATLLLSDYTRDERFLVTYLSDPVVTVASSRLWYQNGLLEKRGLSLVRQKLQHGAFWTETWVKIARFLLLIRHGQNQ